MWNNYSGGKGLDWRRSYLIIAQNSGSRLWNTYVETETCAMYVEHKALILKHRRAWLVSSFVDGIRHETIITYYPIELLYIPNRSAACIAPAYPHLKCTQNTATTPYNKLQLAFSGNKTRKGFIFSTGDEMSTTCWWSMCPDFNLSLWTSPSSSLNG